MNLYLRVIFDRLKRYFISLLISLVIVGFVLFHDFKTNYVTIQIIEYDDSQEEKVILDKNFSKFLGKYTYSIFVTHFLVVHVWIFYIYKFKTIVIFYSK